MQPLYHIQSALQHTFSPQEDKLIIDISLKHLYIICVKDAQLLYLDLFTFDPEDKQTSLDMISALLTEHELLQNSFERVKVIYHTPESILVPSVFYYDNLSEHLMHWQFGDTGNYVPMKLFLQKAAIQLLYSVPEELHQLISIHFPNAQFDHAHSMAVMTKHDGSGKRILITIYPNEWICSFYDQGKLQIVKSIIPADPADVQYAILEISRELNFTSENAMIFISGLINKTDPEIEILSRFFKSINWVDTTKEISLYPDHYFTPVINQSLCEL